MWHITDKGSLYVAIMVFPFLKFFEYCLHIVVISWFGVLGVVFG